MRRHVLTPAAVALVAACAVKSLDVGSDDGAVIPSDGGNVPDAEAGPTISLLDLLTARCAAAKGPTDPFSSAADLSKHLAGRWYMCPGISNWTVDPPQGLELEFTASGTTGTWDFLRLVEASTTFVPSDNVEEQGGIIYNTATGMPGDAGSGDAEAGPDGGTGDAGAGRVPLDDTTPRVGLTIQLVRADLDDFFFVPAFEKSPRRMTLSELGNDPPKAVFVPID